MIKTKSPMAIDEELLRKIGRIKHYQGFESGKMTLGDKMVLFGLIEKEESEDMVEIKKFLRLKQAQKL